MCMCVHACVQMPWNTFAMYRTTHRSQFSSFIMYGSEIILRPSDMVAGTCCLTTLERVSAHLFVLKLKNHVKW